MKKFLKKILAVPRCGSGAAIQVYTGTPPLDLQVAKMSVDLLARIKSGVDAGLKNVLLEHLNSDLLGKDLCRTRATDRTLFGSLFVACESLALPLEFEIAKPATHLPTVRLHRDLPPMPALKKFDSAWHTRRALRFAKDSVSNIRDGLNLIFVDGSLDEQGRIGYGIHAISPDGSNLNIAGRVPGASVTASQARARSGVRDDAVTRRVSGAAVERRRRRAGVSRRCEGCGPRGRRERDA